MTIEEIIEEIRRKPTVPLWPHVGMVMDLSRNGTYDAAKRGDIDVIRIGRLKKAVSAPLRKRLGLEPA